MGRVLDTRPEFKIKIKIATNTNGAVKHCGAAIEPDFDFVFIFYFFPFGRCDHSKWNSVSIHYCLYRCKCISFNARSISVVGLSAHVSVSSYEKSVPSFSRSLVFLRSK